MNLEELLTQAQVCEPQRYRNDEEIRYYGSDLNKFVAENCKSGSAGLIVNNIDLIMYNYKLNKHRFRMIESKHTRESLPWSQRELLRLLKETCDVIAQVCDFMIEIFIIRADPPYHTMSICNVNDEEIICLSQDDAVKWLNFDMELNCSR